MSKRAYHEEASSNDGAVNPSKRTKTKYFSKSFTSRGLSLHQRKYSKNLSHEKNEAKKTRAYKFCILNEYIHEEILSFLSNQTLTKMQLITGDHYEGCEPELAKICCKCENDNFTISGFLCQQCSQSCRSYRPRTTKRMAKAIYGLEDNDLAALPRNYEGSSCLYERSDLMDFISRTCGSKKQWLRRLVKVRVQWEESEAEKSRKKEFYDFLVYRAPELARLKTSGYKDLKMEDMEQWYPRYKDVKQLCDDRKIFLPIALVLPRCKDFIKNGFGSAEDVVNTIHKN
ncbi:hypothetical protein DVH05_009503 [Phytophthora capsici]|nr:hypothetical protein DVH05_009503 [Phytophthora capsici]